MRIFISHHYNLKFLKICGSSAYLHNSLCILILKYGIGTYLPGDTENIIAYRVLEHQNFNRRAFGYILVDQFLLPI